MFLKVAEQVAGEMNKWAQGFFGRPIIDDWHKQLDFTTKIFRARGLHLDDRHVRNADGHGFSASIVDAVLYVVNNHQRLRESGASLVLYLPKIQTAEEAALWSDILSALEQHLGLADGTIKVYVLVEQVEACFQLMEIRAALGKHFVGFNTGRWDYINSVVRRDGVGPRLRQSEHRRHHDDLWLHAQLRGPRAPCVQHARPQRPVRALAGRHGAEHPGRLRSRRSRRHEARGCRRRARTARGRERQVGRALEDGAHRPAGVGKGRRGQPARPNVSAADVHRDDADGLSLLEPAPRTVRGARDLLSVATAVRQRVRPGLQAAALKPADFFGNDDVLYLMEDMATGEIRLSILWEWLHKNATLTAADAEIGVKAGDRFHAELSQRLLAEEYEKLLQGRAIATFTTTRRTTTLPIAREIVETYVMDDVKLPWYIDLLNINLDNHDLTEAKRRIKLLADAFAADGTRITANLDF